MEIKFFLLSAFSTSPITVKIRPFRYGNKAKKKNKSVQTLVKIRPFRYGNFILSISSSVSESSSLKSDRFGMEIFMSDGERLMSENC